MKKVNTMLVEYVKRLSDEDLSWLRVRATQNLFGDRADITNFVSRDREMDRWLASAANADEFFDMVDLLGQFLNEEYEKRG